MAIDVLHNTARLRSATRADIVRYMSNWPAAVIFDFDGVIVNSEPVHCAAYIQLMAEQGMSPEDVLVATTRTAAELMGMSRSLGTIEPGKRADLVVVSGDPFDFSDLAARIERVYQDSRLVVDDSSEQITVPV